MDAHQSRRCVRGNIPMSGICFRDPHLQTTSRASYGPSYSGKSLLSSMWPLRRTNRRCAATNAPPPAPPTVWCPPAYAGKVHVDRHADGLARYQGWMNRWNHESGAVDASDEPRCRRPGSKIHVRVGPAVRCHDIGARHETWRSLLQVYRRPGVIPSIWTGSRGRDPALHPH